MGRARAAEVLLVSLGSTHGLRQADEELADSLHRAGATVELARARPPSARRTLMLTDLAWARAARAASRPRLAPRRGSAHEPGARAVIYSSTTAALLWPRRGAIRFDATAAGNRPGRHGVWQRPLERRRLAQAPLLLPWSEGALAELPDGAARAEHALVLPVAVEPSGRPQATRDVAAVTYAANPLKKGLDRVLGAWRSLAAERGAAPGELLVAGAAASALRRAGVAVSEQDGVRVVGELAREDYRALLRRARVFVCAPRREDYGIAQLEALADGCQLVTTPAPGPYAALSIARALDPRLVADDLRVGLRAALEAPLPGYRDRALELLAPFRREAVDRVVRERLLPRLLGEGGPGEPPGPR